MTNVIQISRRAEREKACVVALHCSLGSGRQWKTLADELGRSHRFFAPDISGYGANTCALDLPLTLAEEVRCLSGTLNERRGRSISSAIPMAARLRSRSRPPRRSHTGAQPDADRAGAADAAVRERRGPAAARRVSRRSRIEVSEDLWNGSVLEAIDKFTEFWNGSGPQDPVPASARLRMIERADKLAFDFTAAFAEENVAAAAASLRVPTLLFSGGLSPYLTQRIVQRLGAIMDGAEIQHLPAAGHMLPLTHASSVNPAIARHIARADELAAVPLAVEAALAEAVSLAQG